MTALRMRPEGAAQAQKQKWRRSAFFRPAPRSPSARSHNGPARRSAPAPIRAASCATSPPLDEAGPDDLAFLDNPHYLDLFRADPRRRGVRRAASRRPGAGRLRRRWPRRSPIAPWRGRWRASIPRRLKPRSAFGETGVSPAAFVHSAARLEPGVVVDPGAVIGPGAEIGAGTLIGPNAVIGPGVRIGRDGVVGAQAHDRLRADRRPRHHPSRRPHRPGRLRFRDRPARPSQGAAGRPGDHPGRRRDRRRNDRSTAAPTATRSSARAPKSTISCRSATTS